MAGDGRMGKITSNVLHRTGDRYILISHSKISCFICLKGQGCSFLLTSGSSNKTTSLSCIFFHKKRLTQAKPYHIKTPCYSCLLQSSQPHTTGTAILPVNRCHHWAISGCPFPPPTDDIPTDKSSCKAQPHFSTGMLAVSPLWGECMLWSL